MLRNRKVKRLRLLQLVYFLLWKLKIRPCGALYLGLLILGMSLGELSTGTRTGIIDRTLAAFEKRAWLLGCSHRIRDVEATLLGIEIVYVTDVRQDIKPLLLGPPENVMVRDVDV